MGNEFYEQWWIYSVTEKKEGKEGCRSVVGIRFIACNPQELRLHENRSWNMKLGSCYRSPSWEVTDIQVNGNHQLGMRRLKVRHNPTIG